ncbi:DUF2489 domain-containing protein [Teredinibacter franksiae]|uniref:DUF2489 domain-containing protein n=1 Tax=Teredinibacter franksiae TaxID=2761453 RepID=UPI001624179B|nr:DUF2489 domain-containing protein [Teredinibacter franksiae]
MLSYLISTAVFVILLLAGIAGYLHWKLYLRNVQRDKQRAVQKKELRVDREKNLNSIEVLLRATLEDQVTLTEACIRTCVLMESLQLPDDEKQRYASFYKLAQATSHIPILAEWKALPTKKKLNFDRERLEQERQYRDFIVSSAKTYLERQQRYRDHILTL